MAAYRPPTVSSTRYSDFPAVTYSVFDPGPPKQQLVGSSGVGRNPTVLPAGVKKYTPAVFPAPAGATTSPSAVVVIPSIPRSVPKSCNTAFAPTVPSARSG